MVAFSLVLKIRTACCPLSISFTLTFIINTTNIQIENEDDILWKADERETHEAVLARGMKFIKW